MTSVSNVAPGSVGSDAPALHGGLEVLRRRGASLQVGERHVVGRDHSRPRAGLDRHVADRHAALDRERLDRRAGVLDRMADRARGADLADRPEDQVLRGDAESGLALVGDAHRARPNLQQALGGEDVLDLGGPDAHRQRAERAVGGRVRVAAGDRDARLREAQLRPDHVHDALAAAAHAVQRHAELGAVALERRDLLAGEVVGDRVEAGPLARVRGDVVVRGRQRAVGPAHLAPGEPQALEGLGGGDLVHQVQVDVEQRRPAFLLGAAHLVRLPDLLEHGLGHREPSSVRRQSPT